MDYKIIITESAQQDTANILAHMISELTAPQAAADFASALDDKYALLESNPFLFELSRNERLRRKGYRRFLVGNYVVPYTIDEAKKEVAIARVFFGRQNYEKLL